LICVEDAAVAVKLLGVVSVGTGVLALALVEYALRFPAASVARTRYEYEVDPVNPPSLNVVPAGVATCVKLEHPAPWHLSTLYPVTPTLSVDAVHDKLTCAGEAAVAIKLAGAVGGVVSWVDGALEHPPSAKSVPALSKTNPRHLDSTCFANRLFILGSIEASATLDNLKEIVPGERKPPY